MIGIPLVGSWPDNDVREPMINQSMIDEYYEELDAERLVNEVEAAE